MPQKYLKVYPEHSEYASGSRPYMPNVSHCENEDHVHYSGEDLLYVPLTFEAKSGDTTITFTHISPANFDYTLKTIQVSTDKGKTWESKTSSRSGTVLGTIKKGQKMLIRGNNTKYNGGVTSSYNYFLSDNDIYVYGNIASIVQSTNFWNVSPTILQFYSFDHLFSGMSQMYSHPEKDLIIPFDLLPSYACRYMFLNCSNLTRPPRLLATRLDNYCYQEMFNGCTHLQTAPELPATTLATGCYNYMFSRCYALTESPVLSAKTLVSNCYQGMFNECSSLNKITCLAINISATDCTTNWTNGVAATGTFIKETPMESWTIDSVNGIPTGWTVSNAKIKLDYYEFTSNEYINLGLINPNKISYPDGSGSPCWGGVQVHFDSSITLNDIDNKTIITNNSHKFSLQSRCTVDGSLITGGQSTNSSWPNQYIYIYMLEASKSSGNYNNAVWWYNGSPGKYYFSTYGTQPWDFINSNLVIGSMDGTTCTSKITQISYMVPTTSSLEWIGLEPYTDDLTGEVVFMSNDGIYQYEIKST